jgi:predicted component of type VI protein secretion system
MKNRHRVVWTKGMLLNPQHRRRTNFSRTPSNSVRRLALCQLGVTALDIDSEASQTGYPPQQLQRDYAGW